VDKIGDGAGEPGDLGDIFLMPAVKKVPGGFAMGRRGYKFCHIFFFRIA